MAAFTVQARKKSQEPILTTFSNIFAPKDKKQEITAEERMADEKAVYELINFDQVLEESKRKYPLDYVQQIVTTTIKECSLQIVDGSTRNCVLSASLYNLQFVTQMRQEWHTFLFDMEAIKMIDFYTREGQAFNILTTETGSAKQHYLQIGCDINPIEASSTVKVDTRIKFLSQAVTFTFSHVLANRLQTLFTLDKESGMKTVIADVYAKGIEQITQEAQNKIKYALTERVALDIDLDLKAPTIIVPYNPKDIRSPAIVVDLGHLSIKSDLSPRDKIVSDSGNIVSDYFYDKFNVVLKAVRASITHNMLKSQEMEDLKCDTSLVLQLLVTPTNELDRVRIDGQIDKLFVRCTPEKISDLLFVLNAVTRNLGQDIKESPPNLHKQQAGITALAKCFSLKLNSAPVKLVSAKFDINRIVVLMQQETGMRISSFHINLDRISSHTEVTTHDIHVLLNLSRISAVDDNATESGTFITSPDNVERLISIDIGLIPVDSPKFDNLDSSVKIDFDTLEVTINRLTITRLLRFIFDIDKNAILQSTQKQRLLGLIRADRKSVV